MPCIYIIYSQKLDKYYVAACTNLERGLHEYSIGHLKFTSLGLPWILKYTEPFTTLPLPKKREFENKKKKSRLYIEKLIGSSVG